MLSMSTLFRNRMSPPETGDRTETKDEKQMFLKQREEANA
jgi:hypothetical protein